MFTIPPGIINQGYLALLSYVHCFAQLAYPRAGSEHGVRIPNVQELNGSLTWCLVMIAVLHVRLVHSR